MKKEISKLDDYAILLQSIKRRVSQAQLNAFRMANAELILLYFDIGMTIHKNQKIESWGTGLIPRLAKDLKNEFSEIKGFSVRNCQFMVQFYLEYKNEFKNAKQPASQLADSDSRSNAKQPVSHLSGIAFAAIRLSWTINVALIQKIKDKKIRLWYMNQAYENGWGREVLLNMIKSNLHQRQGKLVNNFDVTLPHDQSLMVREMLKDPYIFDMLSITDNYTENEIELELIKNIEKFLLELGTGFAFMGRQYHVEVSEKDYYIDLLFYHTKLHAYIVIELKKGEFKPEYAGKLNFYCSLVDSQLRQENDNPTIGLILCQSKDKIIAEYSLRDLHKPIGISEYDLTKVLPKKFKSSLPSTKDLEKKLSI